MNRFLASLCLVVLLAACQSALVADVTRFNSLPPDWAAKSFTIVPGQGQAGSLEFQHDADLVAAALTTRGLRPVPHDTPADLVVFLRYGQAGNHTEVTAYEEPGYAGYGGWGGGPWGWGYPETTYSSRTLYSVFLQVDMLDGREYRAGTRHMLFEGRAIADSTVHDVNPSMPYLVQALFNQFPGPSGGTVKVSVPTSGG
jgi:hypothetical protein